MRAARRVVRWQLTWPVPAWASLRSVASLGRGGMGVVYEAVQTSLGRRVALKVLGSGLGLTPKAIDRFRREAAAAAKLHHTNIVPVYATGEDRRRPLLRDGADRGAGPRRRHPQMRGLKAPVTTRKPRCPSTWPPPGPYMPSASTPAPSVAGGNGWLVEPTGSTGPRP